MVEEIPGGYWKYKSKWSEEYFILMCLHSCHASFLNFSFPTCARISTCFNLGPGPIGHVRKGERQESRTDCRRISYSAIRNIFDRSIWEGGGGSFSSCVMSWACIHCLPSSISHIAKSLASPILLLIPTMCTSIVSTTRCQAPSSSKSSACHVLSVASIRATQNSVHKQDCKTSAIRSRCPPKLMSLHGVTVFVQVRNHAWNRQVWE
jgi:hypothetical protein